MSWTVNPMDQPQKKPPPAQAEEVTFSEAEYSKAIAHASATGRAVIVGANGKPCEVITIPIVDLPTLDY
jgi:hypothetical protein